MLTVLFLTWIYIFSLNHHNSVVAVSVNSFGLSGGSVPEKNNDISMQCNVTISQSDGLHALNVFKGTDKVLTCYFAASSGSCSRATGVSTRYTGTYSKPSMLLSITSLQIADGGNWYCSFQSLTSSTVFQLTVYSSPVSLALDGDTGGGDLQNKSVTLRCKTSNCVYPAPPQIQWFYKKTNAEWLLYQNMTATDAQASCSGSEKIYSTTLAMPRNTVWPLQPSNVETTVNFQCRLNFPTLQSALQSPESGNVLYAVRVTAVTLKDGNNTPSGTDTIDTTVGSPKPFTCTTTTSRPVATIVWYIGDSEKQRSTSATYTYTPTSADNNKRIYCKAFNIQTENDAVSSNQPKLIVKVKVTSVTLLDGSSSPGNDDDVVVTENQEKTLTCRTGDSNPAPTIVWYIGGQMKQTGTDTSFVFTPTNNDHGKQTYCKAYNIQPPEQAVVSSKPELSVRVLAGTPSLTNWTSGNSEFLNGKEATLNCESTPTRPAVSVEWKKGTSTLSSVQNSENTNSVGLMTVTSKVTFTPQKTDNGLTVSCETSIPNQNGQIAQKVISVWWLPSTPFISTNTFPWLEGQNGKQLKCESSDYGNPVSDVVWIPSVFTSATKILNMPTLIQEYDGMNVTCQLKNSYTEKLTSIVQSQIVQLDVQHTPDIFIYINGVEKYSDEINEGENLTAVCSAKGNPVPSVTWQGQATGKTQLVYTDIDRKDHGSYRCAATAHSSHYTNYTFYNETTLHISVRYISVTSFYVEGHKGQNYTTVDEHDTGVKLLCTVNADSAATIQLIFEGDILKEEFEAKSLSFSRSNVDCFHAGVYTCKGTNGHGQQDSKNVIVFVRCSPRPIQQIRRNTTSQLHVPVTLSFTTIAYPEPGPKGFSWYKENGQRWMALLTNEDVYISSSGLQSNLTFRNVSSIDYGEYRVTVTNSIGTYEQFLFLSTDSTNTNNEKVESDNKILVLIVGLSLGCVCIVLAIYATYLTIRQKRMAIRQGVTPASDINKQSTYVNVAYKAGAEELQREEHSQNNTDNSNEEGVSAQYTNLTRFPGDDKSTYEIIQTK